MKARYWPCTGVNRGSPPIGSGTWECSKLSAACRGPVPLESLARFRGRWLLELLDPTAKLLVFRPQPTDRRNHVGVVRRLFGRTSHLDQHSSV